MYDVHLYYALALKRNKCKNKLLLREAAKRVVLFLRIKKKKFDFFFSILLTFKNSKYFTLDNLSIYGHIMLKLVSRYFYWFVSIFAKKYGS